jgi:hypothetical protein
MVSRRRQMQSELPGTWKARSGAASRPCEAEPSRTRRHQHRRPATISRAAHELCALVGDSSMAATVEWSGGANMLRPMTSNVSALSSIVAKGHQAIHFVSSAPSIHSVRRVFPQYGWKSALSSCALPKPFGASFDPGAAVRPFLAISYPGVWNGGCTHRPLAQHGLSCPRLQSLLRPDPPV